MINDILGILMEAGKSMVYGLFDSKRLFLYGMTFRICAGLVMMKMLDGIIPEIMSGAGVCRVLLGTLILYDVYTVLIVFIRFCMKCKNKGITFSLKLNPDEKEKIQL